VCTVNIIIGVKMTTHNMQTWPYPEIAPGGGANSGGTNTNPYLPTEATKF